MDALPSNLTMPCGVRDTRHIMEQLEPTIQRYMMS